MEWIPDLNSLLLAVGAGAVIVKLLDMLSGRSRKRLEAEKLERDNLRADVTYLREEIQILKNDVSELRLHLAASESNVRELSTALCRIDTAVYSFKEDHEVRQDIKSVLEEVDLSKFK